MEVNLNLQRQKDRTFEKQLSGEELLEQAQLQTEMLHRKMLEEQNKPTIEETKERLLNDVLEDTKWYWDSDEMCMLKQQTEALREKWADKETDPEELLFQYDNLISHAEKYLSSREKGRSFYSARHKKVRNLMEGIKAEREDLILKNPGIEYAYNSRRHSMAMRKAKEKNGTSADALRLEELLNQNVPKNEEEFATQKEEILKVYDRLIAIYRKEATGFCFFYSGKVERAKAARSLQQFEKERENFAKKRFDLDYRTWGEDLTNEQSEKVIDEAFLKENPNIRLNGAVEKEDAYNIFSRLAGARECFNIAEKKVKVRDESDNDTYDYYVMTANGALTLEEALYEAEQQGVPLMYSDEALEQMVTIQIIDFIMGQTKRDENSFKVNVEIRNVENIDYLVITSVMAENHENCLGKETADDLNQEKKGLSTRHIFDEEDNLLILGYNHQVADKILAMDTVKLSEYFRNAGVSEENIDAMQGRLQKMQGLLQKDKESGVRSKIEKQMADPKNQDNLHKKFVREDIREGIAKHASNTYILSSLIQDAGQQYTKAETQNEKDEISLLKKINKKTDENLHSEKAVSEKRERIREMLKKDEEGLAGEELQEETREVLDAINAYMSYEHSAQSFQASSLRNKTAIDMIDQFEPERHMDLLQKAQKELSEKSGKERKNNEEGDLDSAVISEDALLTEEEARSDELSDKMNEIFKREEGNNCQYYFDLKSKCLNKALDKLSERVEKLEKIKERTAYQEAELTRFRQYLKEFDKDKMTGNLVYEAKKAKKVLDTKFSKNYSFVSVKNLPLFPEEPKLSDLAQGETGDCYLIAVLGSVVESDPQFIKNHMKDNGDGTVTVKLYKPVNEDRGRFDEVFVTVEKTIAFEKNKQSINANGSMWVQMYEKALLVSGLTGKHKMFRSFDYEEITGGTRDDAIRWVLGTKPGKLFSRFREYGGKDPDWKRKDPKTQKTVDTPGFLKTVEAVKEQLTELFKEDVIVQAGAFSSFKDAAGKGSSGELLRRGMAGMHAYTVLGLEEIEGETYVRVRNPWGRYISEKVMNELTGKIIYKGKWGEEGQGSFLMDIRTFTEHINSVTYVKTKDVKGMQKKNGAA